MPNLTAKQVALVQYIVAAHKGGSPAVVQIARGHFNRRTLNSLVARGLVRHLRFYQVSTGLVGEPMPLTRLSGPGYEVELTSAGWDFLYRIDR